MLSAHRQDGLWSAISSDYDCTENVERLIASGSTTFERIVLSTWDDDHGRQAKNVFQGADSVTVVLSADPLSSSHALSKTRTRQFPDNRVRQFFSTLAGLKACEGAPTEVVAKVRTDQFLDIQALMTCASDIECGIPRSLNSDNRLLLVPCLFGKPPFAADDSYFVATRSTLSSFLEAQLSVRPSRAIADIHSAITLVWFDAVLRERMPIGRWREFPLSGRSKAQRPVLSNDPAHYRIAAEVVHQTLRPLSRAVHQSLVWRGISIQEYEARAAEISRLPPLLFREDLPETPSALAAIFQDLSEAGRRPLIPSKLLAQIVGYERSGLGSLLNPIAFASQRFR